MNGTRFVFGCRGVARALVRAVRRFGRTGLAIKAADGVRRGQIDPEHLGTLMALYSTGTSASATLYGVKDLSTTAATAVSLADNELLSEDQLRRIEAVRSRMRELLAARSAIIKERILDESFVLPSANWIMDDEYSDVKYTANYMLSCDEHELNFLRLRCAHFSGYSLYFLRDSEGLRAVNPVDGDYIASLNERLARDDDPWTARWRRLANDTPARYLYTPPALFGEIGWKIADRIVNHDTFVYQARINLMRHAGLMARIEAIISGGGRPTVLEIGSGYGGLAYALKSLYPTIRYYGVDIPESLTYCGIYLSALTPASEFMLYDGTDLDALNADRQVTLVPNLFAQDLQTAGLRCDVAINTLSMAEMSEHQVSCYADILSTLLGETGIFFEHNLIFAGYGNRTDCKTTISRHFKHRTDLTEQGSLRQEYPNPSLWTNVPLSALDADRLCLSVSGDADDPIHGPENLFLDDAFWETYRSDHPQLLIRFAEGVAPHFVELSSGPLAPERMPRQVTVEGLDMSGRWVGLGSLHCADWAENEMRRFTLKDKRRCTTLRLTFAKRDVVLRVYDLRLGLEW